MLNYEEKMKRETVLHEAKMEALTALKSFYQWNYSDYNEDTCTYIPNYEKYKDELDIIEELMEIIIKVK